MSPTRAPQARPKRSRQMRPGHGVVGAHPSQPAAAVTLRTSCAREVLRAEDAQDPGRHTATVRRGRPTAASHRPGKDNSVQVYLWTGNARASPRLRTFLWQAQPLSKPEGHIPSYTYELARISQESSLSGSSRRPHLKGTRPTRTERGRLPGP